MMDEGQIVTTDPNNFIDYFYRLPPRFWNNFLPSSTKLDAWVFETVSTVGGAYQHTLTPKSLKPTL